VEAAGNALAVGLSAAPTERTASETTLISDLTGAEQGPVPSCNS